MRGMKAIELAARGFAAEMGRWRVFVSLSFDFPDERIKYKSRMRVIRLDVENVVEYYGARDSQI
jgi:hypothetical protein